MQFRAHNLNALSRKSTSQMSSHNMVAVKILHSLTINTNVMAFFLRQNYFNMHMFFIENLIHMLEFIIINFFFLLTQGQTYIVNTGHLILVEVTLTKFQI